MLSALPRLGQVKWVLVFTLLVERAWIHAAASLFFLAIAADAAPSWISTILAISCSALAWRMLLRVGVPLSIDIPPAITLGILATYLILAFQISDPRCSMPRGRRMRRGPPTNPTRRTTSMEPWGRSCLG